MARHGQQVAATEHNLGPRARFLKAPRAKAPIHLFHNRLIHRYQNLLPILNDESASPNSGLGSFQEI